MKGNKENVWKIKWREGRDQRKTESRVRNRAAEGGKPASSGQHRHRRRRREARSWIEMILTETEEERVHAHGVDAEEAVGDEVGAHHHRLQGKTHHQDPMTQISQHLCGSNSQSVPPKL